MASPTEIKPAIAAAGSPAPSIAPAPQMTRQPSICIKPSTSAGSPAPLTPGSVTSKEWVIPPRPKPGRKPATDTPPTKRKAQNRAAQRAFRERRAARVGELEEQIKLVEDEHEREQNELRDQLSVLSTELEQYKSQMGAWVERCNSLEKELTTERSTREALMQDLQTLKDRQSATLPVPHTASNDNHNHEEPLGCGGCSSSSRCECIEAAIDMGTATSPASKRPHSPHHDGPEKRVKAEPVDEPMELDFTHAFSRPVRSQHQTHEVVASPRNVADPCGFCQDGTPCMCAEMAAAENAAAEEKANEDLRTTRIPPIRQLDQFTPPPSDGDVSLPLPTPQPTTQAGSCANGPGSCAQCRADPNSTLFCKTLAAARARSQGSEIPAGCCGGSKNGQSCCQIQSRTLPLPTRRPHSNPDRHNIQNDIQSPSSSSSLTLTCADAYTTLSRHPNYERAISSPDVVQWMPKLYASPSRQSEANASKAKGPGLKHPPSRPAMEIEVANVMSVLREFDRRFGSSA
ncbi:putative bzip transcription factor [Phaeomoniella chlamydospora]|uniref:Putative bzip transcription factor n=1 Tax=Phaeomoniella chlamydospora TaxID=158046 RepID=A0A0G2FVM8_PHACM|nr:putative bzip transcription factor [Phaeomoniella chlamydospora]